MFGCYFKYNGKKLEVVLETHMSSPALWIKEGLIILLIQDVMLYTQMLTFRMPELVHDRSE